MNIRRKMVLNKTQQYTLLFCLVYFTSYITRINYGTAILDIADTLKIPNSLAGIPVSLSFMSYGAGQLLAGYLGDKFNSTKVISVGLFVTALMNFAVSFTDNIYVIMVLWTVNGLAQSFLWPPLVKIMLTVFDNNQYKKSCAYIVMSASVATIFLYLSVPVFISFYSYELIFIISALLATVVLAIWIFSTKTIVVSEVERKIDTAKEQSVLNLVLSLNLLPIMVAIVLQGLLRDGVTTWTPAFINEVFGKSASFSILSTIFLPIFSIISVAATRLAMRKEKKEVLLSVYLWCLATVSGVTLYFGMDNIFVSISALTLLTSCMHAINLLFVCNLPAKFAKYGKVSTVTGLLNSCTYLGSTISAYVIAMLSEVLGWSGNVIFWIAVTVIGALLCIYSNKKLKLTEWD